MDVLYRWWRFKGVSADEGGGNRSASYADGGGSEGRAREPEWLWPYDFGAEREVVEGIEMLADRYDCAGGREPPSSVGVGAGAGAARGRLYGSGEASGVAEGV